MIEELQKLDIIRERMGVNYELAKMALDEAEGDVIQALVIAERKKRELEEDVVSVGAELMNEIEDLSQGSPIRTIRLKLGNRVVKELPVSLTAAAAVVAAIAGVLLTKLAVEIEREE